MALKKSKTRITVNIDKEKYEEFKKIAYNESRSVSSYINHLIDKEIKNKKTRD